MVFSVSGDKSKGVILFFHAMGVTGESSIRVAKELGDKYYCIMPTASLYCEGQKYISKENELEQIENYLSSQGIKEIEMVVASSIGADLAMAFITTTKTPINHIFFDGGQFAQIGKGLRAIMTPFIYFAIKSLYWSKGKSLKKILWCDDEEIKPYFIDAGKNLKYGNLRRQLSCSLEKKPFPALSKQMQEKTIWEFGEIEDHYKYRENVMKAYPHGSFPVFKNYNHMQFQIRDPQGFADMLDYIITNNTLPPLSIIKKQ